MTTESSQPQETEPDTGEAASRESDEPNEYGFSGGATAPEPEPDDTSPGDAYGESIAVPAGDLTGAITAAMEHETTKDEDEPAGR